MILLLSSQLSETRIQSDRNESKSPGELSQELQ